MTSDEFLRAQRLEALLDTALALNEAERTTFVTGEQVEPELRDELVALLKAAMTPGPLDRAPERLAADLLAKHETQQRSGETGQRLGAYRLVRLLGEGGMASVWLAERDDGHFMQTVAVKCLKTGLATSESRARFVREQMILAQMSHPQIARLYDAGVSDHGVPFIVMEWVDGCSLTQYCDERRLSLGARLRLFQKVCTAVAYAHQNLIVHRDLKPGNILVSHDGEPKLLDFGIAKLLDRDAEPMTRSGMYLFTPEYAAPEQLNGGAITTATDIYALGAVLYQLLSGFRPRLTFRNKPNQTATLIAPSEVLQRHTKTDSEISFAQERASTPERLRRALRGDLDTIVMKALHEEPNRRYSTVLSLSEDIERYLQQQPITARKDAWHYRSRKFLRRHVLSVALGVLITLSLVSATAISMYHAQRAQTEATRALTIKSFLTDLFEISDTGLPRDQLPTTERLLQDGAKRVRDEFTNQPELKFDLLLLLGRVQRNLSLYDAAEPLLKEAKAIADEHFPPASEKWLEAQTEWVHFLIQRAQYEQAADLLEGVISRYNANKAEDSLAWVEALIAQGTVYTLLDQFDKAIATSQQALNMAKRLFGDRHSLVLRALRNFGKTLLYAERWDEAEKVQRTSVALSRDLYGEHHAEYANTLSELASVLTLQGKNAEAERLARVALAIDETLYDRPNLALLFALNPLGDALLHQRKFDEAEAVYKRTIEIQTQLTGHDHPNVALALYNLAYVAEGRHQYQEVERLQREALVIYRKHYGSDNSNVAYALTGLATALAAQERYPDALAALQEALEIQQNAYSTESEPIGEIFYDFAFVEVKAGLLSQSLNHAEDALRILTKNLTKDHPLLIMANVVKAKILNRLERYRDAYDLLMPQLAPLRQADSEQDTWVEALIEIGRANAGLKNTEGALHDWEEALNVLHTMESPDAKVIAEVEALLEQARKSSIRN